MTAVPPPGPAGASPPALMGTPLPLAGKLVSDAMSSVVRLAPPVAAAGLPLA